MEGGDGGWLDAALECGGAGRGGDGAPGGEGGGLGEAGSVWGEGREGGGGSVLGEGRGGVVGGSCEVAGKPLTIKTGQN